MLPRPLHWRGRKLELNVPFGGSLPGSSGLCGLPGRSMCRASWYQRPRSAQTYDPCCPRYAYAAQRKCPPQYES